MLARADNRGMKEWRGVGWVGLGWVHQPRMACRLCHLNRDVIVRSLSANRHIEGFCDMDGYISIA